MTLAPRLQKVRIFFVLKYAWTGKQKARSETENGQLVGDKRDTRAWEASAPRVWHSNATQFEQNNLRKKKGPFNLQSIFLRILEPNRAWQSVALTEKMESYWDEVHRPLAT